MKRVVWSFLISALLFPAIGAAQSQQGELQKLRAELEALKTGQAQIQKDLQEIKRLLQEGPAEPAAAAQPAVERFVAVAGAQSKGDPKARVTVIEFSDFQCPFCGRHARETLDEIDAAFVTTGKVRYVFRNFPIEAIHPQAFRAHEAAGCAAEQGKFWEMHDRLFANQDELVFEALPKHAAAIGLDSSPFQACLVSRRSAARVREDVSEGRSIGVSGTPMFFIGLTGPKDDKVKVLRTVRGAQGFEALREAIESVAEAK